MPFGRKSMEPYKRPAPAPARAAPPDIPRPVYGQSPAGASSRDYTQPPPGGAHYPWEPGGGSKIPGVPDNWADFYPNEGEGRGDAWIGPKKAQLNAEHPPSSYQNMGSMRDRFGSDTAGFRDWQSKQIFAGDTWPTNNRSPSGQPGPDWDPRNPPPGSPTREEWFRQHPDPMGVPPTASPAPPPRGGTAIHAPGAAAPGAPAPTGTTASTKKLGLAPVGAENQGAINAAFKGKPNGTTVTVNGRKLFKNPNGAIVDVTDPKNRQRLTNRQGQYAQDTAAPQAAQTQAPAGTMRNLSYQMSPEEMAAQRRQEDANAYRYGSAMPGGGQGQWTPGPQGMQWQAGGGMSPQQNYQNDMMGYGRAPMFQPGGMAQFLSGMGQQFGGGYGGGFDPGYGNGLEAAMAQMQGRMRY